MSTKELNNKDARFDTRLPKEKKLFFERAAQLGGFRNFTDFVLIAVEEKAKEIMAEREQFLASQKDSEIFFDAVFNSKKPNNELRKAAAEFKENIS